MRFKSQRLMIILTLLILVATTSFWLYKKKKSADGPGEASKAEESHEEEAQKQEQKEATVEVVPGEINIYIKAPGTIEFHPEKALRLHPSFAGVVSRVYKDLGDQVRPGDALASIESTVGLQSLIISSPIAGTVLSKNASNGQTVSPEEELFAVGDVSVLRARLSVSARDLKKIKTGQDVLLVSENLDRIATKVSFVSPILAEDTRTATTIADFSFEKFRPGMFVTGALKQSAVKVDKSIPAALCNANTNKVVLSVVGVDGIEQRQVTTGVSDYELCEVKSGLLSGERVVFTKVDKSKSEESTSHD
jgi:cobalt-zinc-cadmium efflux system membrane fusion protein